MHGNNRKAAFYRKLIGTIGTSPFILDALLEGKASKVAQAASALQLCFQSREKYSANGRLSQPVLSFVPCRSVPCRSVLRRAVPLPCRAMPRRAVRLIGLQ